LQIPARPMINALVVLRVRRYAFENRAETSNLNMNSFAVFLFR
jgi:hypothetical protein